MGECKEGCWTERIAGLEGREGLWLGNWILGVFVCSAGYLEILGSALGSGERTGRYSIVCAANW